MERQDGRAFCLSQTTSAGTTCLGTAPLVAPGQLARVPKPTASLGGTIGCARRPSTDGAGAGTAGLDPQSQQPTVPARPLVVRRLRRKSEQGCPAVRRHAITGGRSPERDDRCPTSRIKPPNTNTIANSWTAQRFEPHRGLIGCSRVLGLHVSQQYEQISHDPDHLTLCGFNMLGVSVDLIINKHQPRRLTRAWKTRDAYRRLIYPGITSETVHNVEMLATPLPRLACQPLTYLPT